MRKMLLICVIGLLSVFLVYGFADAKVGGRCVNCHTMHGSQNGVAWGWLYDAGAGESGGPYGSLLVGTCLGCHTTDGADPYAGGYPFVKDSGDAFNDSNCLAGGFFPVTEDCTDNLDGNAHTIGSAQPPPGYGTATWYEGTTSTSGLTCAGTSGCHGSQTIDDPMAAIKGGHHQTATYGYRILAAYNGTTGTPVDGGGIGTKDYEKALIAGVTAAEGDRDVTETTFYHNVYKATGTDSISLLCANCHGVFHSDTMSGGAYIRHPTDVILPSGWQAQTDTVVNDFDAKFNPYGFTDVTDTVADKYVTCLSCHRAHGTVQADLLRFPYTTTEGGEQQAGRSPGTIIAYGCLGCHDGQR
jgi:hypothetical protein